MSVCSYSTIECHEYPQNQGPVDCYIRLQKCNRFSLFNWFISRLILKANYKHSAFDAEITYTLVVLPLFLQINKVRFQNVVKSYFLMVADKPPCYIRFHESMAHKFIWSHL